MVSRSEYATRYLAYHVIGTIRYSELNGSMILNPYLWPSQYSPILIKLYAIFFNFKQAPRRLPRKISQACIAILSPADPGTSGLVDTNSNTWVVVQLGRLQLYLPYLDFLSQIKLRRPRAFSNFRSRHLRLHKSVAWRT